MAGLCARYIKLSCGKKRKQLGMQLALKADTPCVVLQSKSYRVHVFVGPGEKIYEWLPRFLTSVRRVQCA